MAKQVYISADYDEINGDREVVDELTKWGQDNLHKVNFIDMSKVSSGSISNDDDCRICDLKEEFNNQINASSAVIFIVGDMTKNRTAGSGCDRLLKPCYLCKCTPYKKNKDGLKSCKVYYIETKTIANNVSCINNYSYLRHEFEQARKKEKKIIILYNSTRKENAWLPSYMKGYENIARPFWTYNEKWEKVGDYSYIKEDLGF